MTRDPGAPKLTAAQWKALAELSAWTRQIPFRTGEALRRYGFVERQTDYVVGWDYANQRGVFPQRSYAEPVPVHEWFRTRSGDQALAGRQVLENARG